MAMSPRGRAGFDLGRDGETQYGSTMFRLGGVDIAQASSLSRQDIRACLEAAVEAGYPLPRTTTGVHINPIEGVVHLNVTKVGDADGSPLNLVDPGALTQGEQSGRRQVYLYEQTFRKFVPGFERARVIDIGAMIGIRETRLVHGERTLTEADVRGCVKPDDRIACSSWALESHGQGRATTWEFLPDAEWYGIPYGVSRRARIRQSARRRSQPLGVACCAGLRACSGTLHRDGRGGGDRGLRLPSPRGSR